VPGDRVGDGAAEPAVTRCVNFAGVPEVPPVEIRPERIEEDKLRLSGLPEQEIGQALLS
jgi:hypothetical protein